MKLFYGAKDIQEKYYENLTEKDLDEMEKNGQDVTELRKKFAEKQAELNAAGSTDLGRLAPFENTPRDRNTDFFKAHAGKAPLFGKDKFYEQYENAEIVYPVVVQAAPSLYKPGDDPAAAVIVLYGLDEAHKKDFDFLRKVADLLVAMRDGEVEVPKPLKKLVKNLNNPKSHISTNLQGSDIDAESMAGAEFLIDTMYLSQDELPGKRVPNDRVLACLKVQKKSDHVYYQLIKGDYYKG